MRGVGIMMLETNTQKIVSHRILHNTMNTIIKY